MKIKDVSAIEVFDSRGNPTVEATVVLSDGTNGEAKVPSGASTGEFEACELRDGGERLFGKGVLKAVGNVNTVIKNILVGEDAFNQQNIDSLMISEDGTKNKSKLGANATLAVSLANAKAVANYFNIPLYRYLGGVFGNLLPVPMMNILNGGAHANNNVDIQEFMLFPIGFDSFKERMEGCVTVYHNLKKIIKGSTAVGDEGGFAPNLNRDEEALDLIIEAVEKSGYKMRENFTLAIDAAASEWYDGEKYTLPKSQKTLSTRELISYWENLSKNYPIYSIEDPLSENDWNGFRDITEKLGDKIQIVGDDLFVTNTERLRKGIFENCGNAILIKPNQIGTLTETLNAISLAKRANFGTIISHRSGETGDSTIADIAVATNSGQIKTGAPARSDRVEKYNRLLEIEQEIY